MNTANEIEIQEQVSEMEKRSVQLNNLQNKIEMIKCYKI